MRYRIEPLHSCALHHPDEIGGDTKVGQQGDGGGYRKIIKVCLCLGDGNGSSPAEKRIAFASFLTKSQDEREGTTSRLVTLLSSPSGLTDHWRVKYNFGIRQFQLIYSNSCFYFGDRCERHQSWVECNPRSG